MASNLCCRDIVAWFLHNAKEKLGLNVADPGFWCSYHRPAFLQPEDERFEEISALYYRELTKTVWKKLVFTLLIRFMKGEVLKE